MTLTEFATQLEKSGLPVAYEHFDEQDAPKMPFICYAEIGSNNFMADSKVYMPIKRVEVQLFTSNKDLDAEKDLEDALSEFSWNKECEFVDEEVCYRTIYTIQI